MVKHYVNEVGTDLILDTGFLIGTVNDQHIKYRKPSGTTGTWSADLFSSWSQIAGATGTYLLKHTLDSGDFDEPGEWRFHAFVGAIDGTWIGEMVRYDVFDTYE